MNAPRRSNRLAGERSPYLLQHAHNPVDWLPWGDEAFERARRDDKPVFLSIGYSACHWCHVMERESFEDAGTAAVLNEHFVSIKVDREERPDVDQIYQLAHQVLTQRGGGWPLSMFLLPDKRPFFGGTYFPNERRYGMPSFREVLLALVDAYRSRRDEVDQQAGDLSDVLAKITGAATGERAELTERALPASVALVMKRAEKAHGGFGRAPKFPNTMTLDLLACAAATRGDAAARAHLALTLDAMARGGIHDHLGGGFARYSTDERWLIPHFEKMLYDNAQLLRLYVDGARLFARGEAGATTPARCRSVALDIAAYVAREMTDPERGVFYSAQDADSEGEEGRFFVWTPAEIESVVGAADAPSVCAYFGVLPGGNFEHGRSALWTPRALEDVAAELGLAPEALRATIERARASLFEARERRPRPMRDDKCLAGWNALMISALADAGATLDAPALVAAARRALSYWRERAFDGALLAHAVKHGEAYGAGFLDDYAGMALAALDCYEAAFDPTDLAFARALSEALLARFWDEESGDFYYSPADGEVVLRRSKDPHDHAYPGGVGLAADALLRMATATGAPRYRSCAERLLEGVAKLAAENPMGMATLVRAVDRAARGAVEVVIAGDPSRDDTRTMLRAAREVYVPHRALLCAASAEPAREHGVDPALFDGRGPTPEGAPVAYICRGTVCDAPVRTPEALREALERAVRGA